MSARSAALALASLAACAGPWSAKTERAPESQAALARPGADPVLLGTPQGAPDVLPIEQVAVRVRRAADGRLTILEFLSPGLTEAEQIKLRLAVEAGELRPAGEGALGQDSWTTTLQRSRSRSR
jgi:hypothetical protein